MSAETAEPPRASRPPEVRPGEATETPLLRPPTDPVAAPSAGPEGQAGKPRPRRRLRRWLLAVAFLAPLFIAGLWLAVHSIPWMGPLVANTLRSVIGKENVTRLEDFVYAVEDRVNRTFKADDVPKAYWKVPPAPPPAPAAPPGDAEPPPEEEPDPKDVVLPPFAPRAVGPALETFSAEGDGQWVPMVDPRRPEEPARLYKTLLHPDKSRSWAEVFVVAVDLRTVAVIPVMGYQEPRSEKPEAEGYVRRAKIPEEHYGALLGAFNGGFMAEHGRYGVYFDGITFLDPKDDACTLARYDDGSYEVHTWSRMKERLDEMTWYRQAPNCMYEDGNMHPNLKLYHAKKWGATLDGETVIRRSAVGISRDRQVLYVGISNHTNAKVMALGMHHAGAFNVAQMDVNWSYPKFVTYEPDDSGKLFPVALAEGFEFSQHLYLRERSMRDFFYLARREEVTIASPHDGKTQQPTGREEAAPPPGDARSPAEGTPPSR